MKAFGLITICCLSLVNFSCKKQEFNREVTYTIGGDATYQYQVSYTNAEGNQVTLDSLSPSWTYTFAAAEGDKIELTSSVATNDSISINATIWVNEKMITDTVSGPNPSVSITDVIGD